MNINPYSLCFQRFLRLTTEDADSSSDTDTDLYSESENSENDDSDGPAGCMAS